MRKTAAALALLLLLSGCAGGGGQASLEPTPAPYDPEKTAQALLDSGAFSETLEAVDADLVNGIYGLDPAPAAAAAYSSTGATAEEVVVLSYADKDGADAGLTALQQRVEDQKDACDGYLPAELPKLDKAVVSQRGSTVLLVVANDYEAANTALDGLEG